MRETVPCRAAALLAALLWLPGCLPAPPAGSPETSPPPERPGATAAGGPAASVDAEGFTRLRLADFEVFGGGPTDASSWSETGGSISTTGLPRGYICTRREYADFTFRGEFRYAAVEAARHRQEPDHCNTGFLIHITGPHKVWPTCLEVQGKYAEMGQIKSNSREIALEVADDEAARRQARRPIGEWNAVEIISRGGSLTSSLNGVTVCTSRPTALRRGRIGLQAEGFAVEFRNLQVRPE